MPSASWLHEHKKEEHEQTIYVYNSGLFSVCSSSFGMCPCLDILPLLSLFVKHVLRFQTAAYKSKIFSKEYCTRDNTRDKEDSDKRTLKKFKKFLSGTSSGPSPGFYASAGGYGFGCLSPDFFPGRLLSGRGTFEFMRVLFDISNICLQQLRTAERESLALSCALLFVFFEKFPA